MTERARRGIPMKPIFFAPLVAIMLAGAGVGVYLATAGAGSGEEAPAAQATATPTPMPAAQPTPTAAATIAPTPTPTPTPEPTATAQSTDWLTYSDPDFGFSIDYPPDFIVESTLVTGTLPPGVLRHLRAVDKRFTEGYPPGQVAFGVFLKDASTPAQWVSKHSIDAVAPVSDSIFFYGVSSAVQTTVTGRQAVLLEWNPGGEGASTSHSVVFFSTSYVFEIHWYAQESKYESTIHSVFDRMLASYRD
jgi:hypothetical protein